VGVIPLPPSMPGLLCPPAGFAPLLHFRQSRAKPPLTLDELLDRFAGLPSSVKGCYYFTGLPRYGFTFSFPYFFKLFYSI
jgi:hypothetical protein